MQNFLELQCIVDDLVNFLDFLIFISVSLKYIIWQFMTFICITLQLITFILFDEMDRGLGWHELINCSYTCGK